jgi:hypothetical protein
VLDLFDATTLKEALVRLVLLNVSRIALFGDISLEASAAGAAPFLLRHASCRIAGLRAPATVLPRSSAYVPVNANAAAKTIVFSSWSFPKTGL